MSVSLPHPNDATNNDQLLPSTTQHAIFVAIVVASAGIQVNEMKMRGAMQLDRKKNLLLFSQFSTEQKMGRNSQEMVVMSLECINHLGMVDTTISRK